MHAYNSNTALPQFDFLAQLKEDIAKCLSEGKTIEAYIQNQLGIVNVMDYEFSDLKDKDLKDFNFAGVRGNTRLMDGKIRTYKESEMLKDQVSRLDFSKLKI